jgi:hypothetical protein
MSWWRRLFGPPNMGPVDQPRPAETPAGRSSYYNEEWNFSIAYPKDWRMLWENRARGPWAYTAFGEESRATISPGFAVLARKGQVLEGDSTVTVHHIDGDGIASTAPKSPAEFIENVKQDLMAALSGLLFHSTDDIEVNKKPATRVIYSYDTDDGKKQQMSVTVFGVNVTFQITCEAAADDFTMLRSTFDDVISSFRIGRKDESHAEDAPAATEARAGDDPLALYNHGVKQYQKGEFESAMQAFASASKSGQFKMQAAYARALCRKELGLSVDDVLAELGHEAEQAGPIYLATNLACYLIGKGHDAALVEKNESGLSIVWARVQGSLYGARFTSLFGNFVTGAWRQEVDKAIEISELSNPTEADKMMLSLANEAYTLPMCPIPEAGLRNALERQPLKSAKRASKGSESVAGSNCETSAHDVNHSLLEEHGVTRGAPAKAQTRGKLRQASQIMVFLGPDCQETKKGFAGKPEAYVCAGRALEVRKAILSALPADHTADWVIIYDFHIPGQLGQRCTERAINKWARKFTSAFHSQKGGRFRSLDVSVVGEVDTSKFSVLVQSEGRADTACACCDALDNAGRNTGVAQRKSKAAHGTGPASVRKRSAKVSAGGCPKCGFTYKWDGTRCGHCGFRQTVD